MLTNEQILAAIDAAESSAFGPESSEIASDRADALDRYMGKPYGDEKPGRSSVVSRDVSDVVEGVTANVLKPFVGGDKVVTFNPRGPEDEEGAQQETDYVNFVVMDRNNGFVCLNSAVKDALLLRNGYLKLGWTKREDITTETYQGLSDEELALLAQDEDVEIVGHSEYSAFTMPQILGPDGMPQPQEIPLLHDVKVRRKQPTEYVEIMPAPPDEILVSQRATEPSVQGADFVQHRTHKTLSELRGLGYKVSDEITDDEAASETIEDYARNLFSSESEMWSDPTNNTARRLVLFKESWIRLDVDGDGIAELRRICQVGKTLLANEEADLIPIACFTPVLMAHRHLGVSVYDLIKDIAEIKTAMLRSHLDNRYLSNNAEKVINVDAVENIDDFLISRPGGLKRVKGDPAGAVMPLVVPDTGSGALMTLEYLDSIRENRTGYTKAAEGMKSGSLATGTATEYMNQISQSGVRLEMVARTIAETGMRDLFRLAHALTLKHSSKAEKVRLRNKWVTVNPREWVRRTDLSISVGLGSTTGPQQLQNLMMIGQAQQQAMPLGIVTPENVYNTLAKMATAAGFKNPEEFFTKPEPGQQPPQNKDPLVQAEEVKAQTTLQAKQMDGQIKGQEIQAKTQADGVKMQQEAGLKQFEVEKQAELKRFEIEQDAMLEKYKIDRQIEADILKAQISARAQVSASYKEQTGQDLDADEDKQRQTEERESQRDMSISQILDALKGMMEEAASPMMFERDPAGRVAAVVKGGRKRKVQRGPDGGIVGIQ